MMATKSGQPADWFVTPNSPQGGICAPSFALDIPSGSIIFADRSYKLYWLEDVLNEVGIELLSIRKQNSKPTRNFGSAAFGTFTVKPQKRLTLWAIDGFYITFKPSLRHISNLMSPGSY